MKFKLLKMASQYVKCASECININRIFYKVGFGIY